jgi:hypothetical protein
LHSLRLCWLLLLGWLLLIPIDAGVSAELVQADVCIYGGTSGGVAAALQAARLGKITVFAKPGQHLGGMTAGGLSAVDIGDPRSVGGIARPLTQKLSEVWQDGFAKLQSGRLDPAELARGVAQAEQNEAPPNLAIAR